MFKLPAETCENHCVPACDRYCACPLLDYFNVYGSCFAPPRIDECLCVNFFDRTPLGYTQIDITKIAEEWLKGEPENKGLILNGAPNTRQVVYASNRFEAPGMHPLLRLTYKNTDYPLSVAPCTVDVK